MVDTTTTNATAVAARHVALVTALSARARANVPAPSHTKYLTRPSPLAGVIAACSARPELDALVPAISAFIDTNGRRWTIERASALGLVQLLQRLVAHELPGSTIPRYRSHVFSRAAVHAVRHGSIAMLECLRTYCPDGFASHALELAAANGRIDLLDWLAAHCHNIIWTRAIAAAAARSGHLHALQWLGAHAPESSALLVGVVAPAAANGDLAMLKWLLDVRSNSNTLHYVQSSSAHDQHDVLTRVAERGHTAALAFLHDVCGLRFIESEGAADAAAATHPIDAAAMSGSVETLDWLYANGYRRISKRAIAHAAPLGHLDAIHWLLAHAPISSPLLFDAADCECAATNGHLDVAQLLFAIQPFALSDDVLAKTAEHGHFAVVKWLVRVATTSKSNTVKPHHNSCTLYKRLLWAAATHGHLAVVKWVYRSLRHAARTPLRSEEDAMSGAAHGGHRNVLTWLYARWPGDQRPVFFVLSVAGSRDVALVQWLVHHSDALVNSTAVEAAASSNDIAMLEVVSRYTRVQDARLAMRAAAATNALDAIEWLAARDAPRNLALKTAVERDRVRIAKWLVATATASRSSDTVDSVGALNRAASLEMVEWLLTIQQHTGDVAPTALAAAQRGDLDTLLLLHEVRGLPHVSVVPAAATALAHDHVEVFEWLRTTFPSDVSRDAVRRCLVASGVAATYLAGVEARERVVTIRFHH